MMRSLLAVCLLGACTEAVPDITGPFTGTVHRYAVNAITMPADQDTFGEDLDGDGYADNRLGFAYHLLAGEDDVTTKVGDLITSGAIASSVEIQTDDLENGKIAGVAFRGADGDTAVQFGDSRGEARTFDRVERDR